MRLKFFTNISHELRTPLTLVMAPIELLLKRNDLVPQIKDGLRLVYKNSSRLHHLINELLYFRKVEQDKDPLLLTDDELVAFLQDITDSFFPLAEKYNIDLVFQAPDEPLHLPFDKDKVEKIYSNLLSNAIKFTPENGTVNVYLSPQIYPTKKDLVENDFFRDGYIEIKVKDTGKGIQADKINSIFKRFYQADISFSGSGIGLELTRILVERHNGKLSVESEEGKGSCFTVRLPIQAKIGQKTEAVTNSSSGFILEKIESTFKENLGEEFSDVYSPLNSSTILIVEDNADLRDFLYGQLKGTYHVIVAKNGKEGLDLAQTEIPELIISDVMMPEMCGIQFTGKIKSDIKTSHIPVILLTARTEMEIEIEGLGTGADDYITKPFQIEALQLKIRNILTGRRKLIEKLRDQKTFEIPVKGLSSLDNEFLCKCLEVLDENISEMDISVEKFSEMVGMCRANLFRKLKAITGQSPTEFIFDYKLRKSTELLKTTLKPIKEIAYECGFNNPNSFTNLFRKKYGKPPSEYRNSKEII